MHEGEGRGGTLQYKSQVWGPHLQKDIKQLEGVQIFGLRICAKQWDLN